MKNLDKYIYGLLFMHDCVIIPGFGGFITNYHQAEHEELSNTFYPPKKDIHFNKNLTYNDGLLINTVAKNLDINYCEAEDYVKNTVQNIWLNLESDKKIYFENIGTFEYKNEKLIFYQEKIKNFLSDSFGLSVFRFPTLGYQKNTQNLSVTYNSTAMTNGLKQTLKWAAFIIPIIGIIALIPYIKNSKQQTTGIDFYNNKQTQQAIENTYSAMAKDTNIASIMDKTTDKKTALFYTEESEKNKPDLKKQNNENKTFYIIGASYKNKDKALKQIKIFKKQGFDNSKIIETNDLFRVSIISFDNKVNALHELRKVRNESKNDKFWLLAE